MSHGPVTEWKEDKNSKLKSKLGGLMFLIYTLVYSGFILINVIRPKLMKIDIGGLNLAIVYGFGLIILALVQAVTYNHICTRAEENEENNVKATEGSNEK